MVASVDLFIFYDDVHYIKGGWINRNKIISGNKEYLFTIPLADASSFKLIKDTGVNWKVKDIPKLLSNIKMSYARAPYFKDVMPIVEDIFSRRQETISQMAIDSVMAFSRYLGIGTQFKVSSQEGYARTDDRLQNLVNILNAEKSDHYINPIGGMELYTKEEFAQHGIKLNFIKGQGSLSIIDVCMSRPVDKIKETISNYTLI
ncbi:WbqC family protein [Nemorincola caseinilytica]|uniref:WbqC family protein n=1 Tax=Nemorincola caseinilytica TaxID=2054315 RepID=A0ABP8NCN7_9BACT